MCGRFSLRQPENLSNAYNIPVDPLPPPRYNIAPSQPVGVIVEIKPSARQYRLMQWGLIPSWAKDPTIGNRLINARAETAKEKPSFRAAFKRRRCLIPADSFYEWKREDAKKQPYQFQYPGQPLFTFAGLWENWNDIETCTILTTKAKTNIKPYHHRMPVILDAKLHAQWLDPSQNDPTILEKLIQAIRTPTMEITPISKAINNARQDHPDCLQPLS